MLELSITFFEWLGVNYKAVDGSPAIVKKLQEKFPKLSENIRVADFTHEIPSDGLFDIVVARASLTHYDTESVRRSLSIIYKEISSGGSFIGIY